MSIPASEMAGRARALHRTRIGALLRLAQRKASADADVALSASGVGAAQIEVLAAVAAYPETDQRAIGGAVGIDRSSMSALADAGAAAGWLVRTPGSDRRRKLLALTSSGRTLLEHGLRALQSAGDVTLAPVAPESRLIALLHRLADAHGELENAPPPLRSQLLFLLRRTSQAAGALFEARAGADALPGLDYSILLLLAEALAASQADLLAPLSTYRSSAGPAIRRLEATGLIERVSGPGDRRQRLLRATDAGRLRVTRLEPLIRSYEDAFLAPLDAGEIAGLRGALLRIDEAPDD